MDTNPPTDKQLIAIAGNNQLDESIRAKARQLLEARAAPIEAPQETEQAKERQAGLSPAVMALLLLLPFLFLVHSIASSKFLARGQRRKWRQYWVCVAAGLCLWCTVILLFSRYLFATHAQ